MQQPVLIQNIDPNSAHYGELVDPDNSGQTWTFTDPLRGTDQAAGGRLGLRVAQFNQVGQEVRRIRIFYRTQDGFTAQVLKPYASYMNAERGDGVPSYKRFRYIVDNGTNELLFTVSDVSKSVSVDYTYETARPCARWWVRCTPSRSCRHCGAPGRGLHPTQWDSLLSNVPLDSNGNARPVCSIDSVRGMSLEVRVVWPRKGTPNRIYKILQDGWGNTVAPSFWGADGPGTCRWKASPRLWPSPSRCRGVQGRAMLSGLDAERRWLEDDMGNAARSCLKRTRGGEGATGPSPSILAPRPAAASSTAQLPGGRRSGRPAGFSLPELLVVVAILSISVCSPHSSVDEVVLLHAHGQRAHVTADPLSRRV